MIEFPFHTISLSVLCTRSVGGEVAENLRAVGLLARSLDVGGVAVFDGRDVLYCMEGTRRDVHRMMQWLRENPAHLACTVLHEAPCDGVRRFRDWASAYPHAMGSGALAHLATLTGDEALRGVEAILRSMDLD